jgi:BirA family biotin operon repressor/biotin-[acetyl-CoA-carboxylase] ligase
LSEGPLSGSPGRRAAGLHRLGTVGSTQVAAAGLPVGSIVVADHQTEGRGRLGRTWQSAPGGGLYATFVLAPRPLLLFAVGVACARACGQDVRLKWPNDLVREGLKVGGILADARPDRVLVGVGVNLAWAPAGAACLNLDRDALLAALMPEVEAWVEADGDRILAEWRRLSWTLGQRVRAELGGEVIEGLAEDIAEDGALVVGGRRVVAGDVTRLRTAG